MTNLEKNIASLQAKITSFENIETLKNENELILSEEAFENSEEIDHFINDSINSKTMDLQLVIQSKNQQKELILNELSELSRIINKYKIKIDLIDYTIPFHYDIQNTSTFLSEQRTQLEEVIAYFLFYGYKNETLAQIERDLLNEEFFFGLEDVKRKNGRFKYKSLIIETKNELKKLGVFDTRGKISELGTKVKSSLQRKKINIEKSSKSKNGPCYRIGISLSTIEKEIEMLEIEL